jgi:hypothetical protein
MYPCQCTGPTGNGIKYSYLDSCGNLVLVYDNNFTNTIGNIHGPTGPTGINGAIGTTGPTGNGVDFVYLDSCCNLVMVMTNGNTINVGNYLCNNSCTGLTGCDSCIYYGTVNPSGTDWPINTIPSSSSPPIVGNVYVNINTGCLYIFNGLQWVTCPTTSPPTVNVNGGIIFYGDTTPTNDIWPLSTLPIPSANAVIGNVYANQDTGNLYLYNGTNWYNFQGGDFIKYRCTSMTIHIVPSSGIVGYATELTDDVTVTSSFTKLTTVSGSGTVDLVGPSLLWPPPINSTYFVCNEAGVYNLTCGFNYNQFVPYAPSQNTGDVVFYVLDSTNTFTNQSCTVGSNTTIVLDVGSKIVVYTSTLNTNNLLTFDAINTNVYVEFARKY